jgi:transcriptional regulator with XRE-family HTH domain
MMLIFSSCTPLGRMALAVLDSLPHQKGAVMIEFRTYLRQLRIARGMTQLDLADAVGLPVGLVSAWEQGRALPALSQLNATMRVLSGDVQCALNLIEGVGASSGVLPALPTPEAIAAVVLDSVAADHGRAEQLLYQALRAVISEAPLQPRRSTQARRRSNAHQRDL